MPLQKTARKGNRELREAIEVLGEIFGGKEFEQEQVTGGNGPLGSARVCNSILAVIAADEPDKARPMYKACKAALSPTEKEKIRKAFFEKYGYAIDDADTAI